MSLIKVRESSEPVKAHQKSSVIASHIRKAYTRTKEQNQRMTEDTESSPSEYASNNAQYMMENVVQDAGHVATSSTKAAIQKAQKAYRKHRHRNETGDAHTASPSGDVPNHDGIPADATGHEYNPMQSKEALEKARTSHRAKYQLPKAEQSHISVPAKSSAESLPGVPSKVAVKDHAVSAQNVSTKALPKPTNRKLLTVQKGVRTSVKANGIPQAAAKSAQATQQTATTAYRTAKASTMAAKTLAQKAAAATKAASKFLVSSVKAAIAGTKALIAALAAGGWVAVIAIVIICLIGLIVSSSWGIFFSSEDTGSSQTMQEVIREINTEYEQQLDNIRTSVSYDELEIAGSRAVWPEVLAIYAVKTTTDADNPQEVASVTDEKIQLLREIFWQMNEISYETASVTEMELIETDDGNGNIVEEWRQVTHTYLYITITHKTAAEMASELGFNDDQLKQMEELLASENATLWTNVMYGIAATDGQIIEVARSQIGNVGGQPYWSWYGFTSRVAWCACFVSWCANECGYIEAGIIPKFASCVNGVQWFRERGQWADSSIEPTPGMLIFFDWNYDGHSDHVGIVEQCDGGIVYTIEGNSSDSCRERTYAVGHRQILGYGMPAY